MKALLFLLVHLLMLTTGHSLVGSQEEEDAGFRKWESYLGTCHSADPDEALTELGRGLLKLSQPSIYHERPRADRLSKLFADEIMSRKGHAQFFVDQFEVKRPGVERSRDNISSYLDARMSSSLTLQLLPSLENAQLMCELLEDDQRIMSGDAPSGSRGVQAVSGLAANVLSGIIATPPKDPALTHIWDHDWEEWKEEVQAGRLAFQLKGDPRWYDLEGPIGKAKASGISADGRIARVPGTVSASHRGDRQPRESERPKRQSNLGLLVALVLIGAALLVFFLRQRIWSES